MWACNSTDQFMEDKSNSLTEHYGALSDDELKHLAITGGFTTIALELLERELQRRGINDVDEYHLQYADHDYLEKAPKKLSIVSENHAIRLLRSCAAFLANALVAFIRVGFLKSLCSLLVKLFTHSTASI